VPVSLPPTVNKDYSTDNLFSKNLLVEQFTLQPQLTYSHRGHAPL